MRFGHISLLYKQLLQ